MVRSHHGSPSNPRIGKASDHGYASDRVSVSASCCPSCARAGARRGREQRGRGVRRRCGGSPGARWAVPADHRVRGVAEEILSARAGVAPRWSGPGREGVSQVMEAEVIELGAATTVASPRPSKGGPSSECRRPVLRACLSLRGAARTASAGPLRGTSRRRPDLVDLQAGPRRASGVYLVPGEPEGLAPADPV